MGIKEVKRQTNIRKWTQIFSERNASGLTVRQYCEEHGITKDQYYYWLKVVREAAIEMAERQNALVEIPTTRSDVPAVIPSGEHVNEVRPDPCILIQTGTTMIQVDSTAPVALVRGIMEVIRHA